MAISSTGTSARPRWTRWFRGLGMIACVAVATGASAADPPGKAVFEQYCASCHGMAADGNGPVAAELKVAPSDLRKLGKEFGTPLAKPKSNSSSVFTPGRHAMRVRIWRLRS